MIIFLTGHGEVAMSVQAMKAGAVENDDVVLEAHELTSPSSPRYSMRRLCSIE